MNFKNKNGSWAQSLMIGIPASQEAEISRTKFEASLGKKVSETLSHQ
jgi:hypothetical protein